MTSDGRISGSVQIPVNRTACIGHFRARSRAASKAARRVAPLPMTRAALISGLPSSARSISTKQTYWSGYRRQISAHGRSSVVSSGSCSAAFMRRSFRGVAACQVFLTSKAQVGAEAEAAEPRPRHASHDRSMPMLLKYRWVTRHDVASFGRSDRCCTLAAYAQWVTRFATHVQGLVCGGSTSCCERSSAEGRRDSLLRCSCVFPAKVFTKPTWHLESTWETQQPIVHGWEIACRETN